MSTKTNTPDAVAPNAAEAYETELMARIAELEAEKKKLEEENEALKADKTPDIGLIPDDGDEIVEIRLFKDNGAYKDDLTVGVNGEFIKIQRGKVVKVKKKFWRVIEQSLAQNESLATLIENETRSFENAAKERGLE